MLNYFFESKKRLLTTFVVAVSVFLTLFFILSSVVAAKSKDAVQNNGKLVTIYDRDIKRVIITHADTVMDAIADAGIEIDPNDAVEPSVEKEITVSDYKINIYRARPVLVIDGNIRQKVMTPYQTAEQIVNHANIKIYPEDQVEVKPTEDLSDGLGIMMEISRSTPFNFTLFGKTIVARTMAVDVKGMLGEKGIILGENDRVLPDLNSLIKPDMSIRVWREGKQTITVEEEVDYEIETIQDADQPVSYLNITTAGVKGLRTVTYEITIEDGQEVKRLEIASVQNEAPIKQVQVVGVKGKYTTPTENQVITWNFLLDQGFSKIQTAGIMGNLMQEHRFNTSDEKGGLGIAQWIGGRRERLLSRDDPYNIYTQLDFLMYELDGSYKYVQTAIKNATTVEESVQIFQNQFERCGICKESKRIEYAYDILGTHN